MCHFTFCYRKSKNLLRKKVGYLVFKRNPWPHPINFATSMKTVHPRWGRSTVESGTSHRSSVASLNYFGMKRCNLLSWCLILSYFSSWFSIFSQNYHLGLCDGEWWQGFVCVEKKVREKRGEMHSGVPICSNHKNAVKNNLVSYMLLITDPQSCSSCCAVYSKTVNNHIFK